MQKWLFLLAGGMLGTAARYALAGVVYRWFGAGFPYGTLAVNALGCLMLGFISTLAEQRFFFSPNVRLFWTIGLLGAFTTFSTLIYESWRLLQDGEVLLAVVNLQGSLAVGLAALWVGHVLASLL
jgi:CrcB protein